MVVMKAFNRLWTTKSGIRPSDVETAETQAKWKRKVNEDYHLTYKLRKDLDEESNGGDRHKNKIAHDELEENYGGIRQEM